MTALHLDSSEIPTSGLERFIVDLAKKHSVEYQRTSTDVLADTITRLADDDVQMDGIECLLIALERAGVVESESVVPLHVNYLREKFSV